VAVVTISLAPIYPCAVIYRVLTVALVAVIPPPTYKSFPIPAPPTTVSAPVVVDVALTLLPMFKKLVAVTSPPVLVQELVLEL
jgi:hypothetical protein